MTRTRIALTMTTLGLAGLLGLTGCAAGTAPPTAPVAAAADVADEAYALAAVGLTTGLEADPAPSASTGSGEAGTDKAGTDKARRHPGVRRFLKKNTLHGEMTVQGKNGVKTVVVQRGTVTAVDATTVSVKSADGFTQSWTFGDKLRVVQDRKTVATAAIKNGAEIGIAGAKDGDRSVARLVVIK
ncbi:hypothetical protein DMB66_37370 [Actinoplanes sp. ATCC 53533]|uniref:hypothetical protein n=1 Tax=Actinoplanes sp. ATCC 53533 TaxID=1288362 RepID=UPI000F768726|nr:hypothetical protein [Actinoplanes sp. ATCC 53533]RSM54700.1 hypothetical protein DMB66_37370 [Actinoplanes sp. ATCC 53533]